MPESLDPLSQPAREVLRINVEHAYSALVPTSGNPLAREKLENLKPQDTLAKPKADIAYAKAVLSGLWLWHDWLDDSHRISQSLQTAEGSFWHAIMHRREGDFSNSKYWYARCADHPIEPALGHSASELINPFPADKSVLRLTHHGWSPDAFVDLVEIVHEHPDDPRHSLCVALQQLEWRMLFDYCARGA